MPCWRITLEWLARNDESTRFRTRGSLEGFWLMNQQSSSAMRFCHVELMILIRRLEGGEICQKCDLVQNLAPKCNPIKESSHRGFNGGYEITSRCIAFRSPIASSYAQSNNITSKQRNPIMMSFIVSRCMAFTVSSSQ
jgi:hypothetical protein